MVINDGGLGSTVVPTLKRGSNGSLTKSLRELGLIVPPDWPHIVRPTRRPPGRGKRCLTAESECSNAERRSEAGHEGEYEQSGADHHRRIHHRQARLRVHPDVENKPADESGDHSVPPAKAHSKGEEQDGNDQNLRAEADERIEPTRRM